MRMWLTFSLTFRSISLIGILSTLAISILPLATSATNIGNIMMNDAGVVYDVVEAIDNKAWNDYVALQCNANKQDYRVFLSNQQNEEKHQGLFNVISAEIVELKELTLKDVSAYTRINEYQEQYQQLAAYYVGIDYDVYEETKYYFDGVNYNLVITAVEDGSWKIVEMSDAPIESLVPMGLGFNSINENGIVNKSAVEKHPKLFHVVPHKILCKHPSNQTSACPPGIAVLSPSISRSPESQSRYARFGVNDGAGFREPCRQRGIFSYRLSVFKKYPQLIRHHIPVSANHRPVIHDILRRKIQHFPQRVIVRKRRFVLRDLPELSVQSFDDIRRIYDPPHLCRICKKRRKNIPVLLPASHAAGIRFVPLVFEFRQSVHSLVFVDRFIDLLQVCHHFFHVLPVYILRGGTDLMNDAPLDL